MTAAFQPDYRHLVAAARNQRPARLPFYEHHVDEAVIMAAVLNTDMTRPASAAPAAWRAHFEKVCRFWRTAGYDTISFECGICPILPEHGAILGGRPGPIQTRSDFERYPWADLPRIFWNSYTPQVEALAAVIPPGMKAVGGCGYGVFEISEDLVGYQQLCLLYYDDPELFADLYRRIGDLMVALWTELLRRYGDLFAVCRMGDDLGFKTTTLLPPELIIQHVIPQHRRLVALAHAAGKPFLLHSCGSIFGVMEELLATGIDAKHSNEDQIAPFARWIELYADRIGLLGGVDVNTLCLAQPQAVFEQVYRQAREFRQHARGYALGSGNSIPDYVPVASYLAMLEAGRKIRADEGSV